MGGRGRGRGGRPSTTFTHEQSASMGLTGAPAKGDMPPVTLVLPPDFPVMANKPVSLKLDIKGEYLITIKKDLVTRLRETAASMVCTSNRTENKYADILNGKPDNPMHDFPWSHVPTELKPNFKRKAVDIASRKAKQARVIDIASRLKTLEDREKIKSEDVENAAGTEGNDENEQAEGAEYIEDDQPDEEMDMETDYANDYFDNGEGFEDEDDQLDEPIF